MNRLRIAWNVPLLLVAAIGLAQQTPATANTLWAGGIASWIASWIRSHTDL